MSELPQMRSCNFATSTYDGTGLGISTTDLATNDITKWSPNVLANNALTMKIEAITREDKEEDMTDQRRLVKVLIVDPEEEIPLDRCLLYNGEEHLTDLTDEELFFEIPVKELLDKHNEYRETVEKDTNRDKVEFLKPVRIRDLRMVVVTVAAF